MQVFSDHLAVSAGLEVSSVGIDLTMRGRSPIQGGVVVSKRHSPPSLYTKTAGWLTLGYRKNK